MSVTFKPTGTRVDYENPSGAWINLNNANARALLAALGFATPAHLCRCEGEPDPSAPNELMGDCTLAEARQALLVARNVDLSSLERPELRVYGAPAAQDDGTIELRPLRRVIGGLDQNGLKLRLAMFADLVARAAELGAPGISWF